MLMETERLTGRPMKEEDAPVLFQFTSDPGVARYMRWDAHQTMEETQKLLEEYLQPDARAWLFYHKETSEPVGAAALKPTEEKDVCSGPLFFAPGCWGKGYASELTPLLLEAARSELHAKKMVNYVVGENMGSRRVLEKCGFTVEKVFEYDDLSSPLYVYAKNLEA